MHRPIRSAGVLALLVAATAGLSVDRSEARPSKRAPQRTAKQVKPPVRAPLPRANPLREIVPLDVAVPLPRPNPLNAVEEVAAPSLRVFAPSSPSPPSLRAGGTVSAVALKEPRVQAMPAEFAARELAFTAVIGETSVGELPSELLAPSPLYRPEAPPPMPAALAPTPRQVAAALATAVVPSPAPALPVPPPPPAVETAPVAVPPPWSSAPLPPRPPLEKRPVETAAASALPPLPPAPPLEKRPLETAAAPALPAPVPPPPPAAMPVESVARPALEPTAPAPAPAPTEVAAVAPAEPVPTPEPAPADSGFGAEDAAEDTTGVHEYASLAEVPDVVRQLAESLPECVPLEKGARRQPFGERTLFSFACPTDRPDEQDRAFVLARDELGNGANVLMFPRPGGKAVEPLHELSNPRVTPGAREFVHTAVDPSDRPCRQQGRWRVDERGNAGLLGWRSSTSCDGEWTTLASKGKDPPAAKSKRGSKKKSARKASRSKGKATARKPAAKKKPVKKKR